MTATETAPSENRRLTAEEVAALDAADREKQLVRHQAVLRDGASPCPVAWCDQAGEHLFYDEEDPAVTGPWQAHTRECRHEVATVGARARGIEGELITTAAAVYENDEGQLQQPYVDINMGDIELRSPAEVDGFVAAIHRAATIAFSTDEHFRAHREAVLEFDAAVAECVARAGKPGNRADAALIRLRNAQDALDATR